MKKEKSKKSSSPVVPLGDRILIKEIKENSGETMSKGGIIIPETVHEDKGAKKGSVIAVGKGRYDDGVLVPMEVSVGDTVLFQWGDQVKISGEEYHIVSESQIIAIVK
ncbi:MAG TPA: co-chaperone GroES [Candidatus Paceibacterota bacterium]